MPYKTSINYTETIHEIKRLNELNKKLAIEKLELKRRITAFEDKEKHLPRVVYNTARIAFEAGACCPYMDFRDAAIDYAKGLEGGVK